MIFLATGESLCNLQSNWNTLETFLTKIRQSFRNTNFVLSAMNPGSSSQSQHAEESGNKLATPLSLSELEFEALSHLDESISFYEESNQHLRDDQGPDAELSKTLEPGALFSLHNERGRVFAEPKQLNAGYILFDGVEIKYVSKSTSPETFSNKKPRAGKMNEDAVGEGSIRNNVTSFTRVSELDTHLNISSDELLAEDFLNSFPRISLTVSKRLPTCAYLSPAQKFYMFVTGLATVSAFNAFYVSLAYFTTLLGDSVLSTIGEYKAKCKPWRNVVYRR